MPNSNPPIIKRVIEKLGCIASRGISPDEEAELARLDDAQKYAEFVANKIAWNNVVEIALNNLHENSHNSEFLTQATHALSGVSTTRYGPILPRLEKCLGLFERFDHLFIKGAAVARAYARPELRCMHDADLLLPDYGSLWDFISSVASAYTYTRLKVFTYKSLATCGSINLIATDPYVYPKLDVKIRGFHIWGAARYIGDLWKRSIILNGIRSPSWEDSIVLIAAHVATDWSYTLRDINDFYSIVSTFGRDLDWEYIAHSTRNNYLMDLMNLLIADTNRICQTTIQPLPSTKTHYSVSSALLSRTMVSTPGWILRLPAQCTFVWQRYAKEFGIVKACIYLAANSYCLVRFNYRAYSLKEKPRIKRLKANEIIVFVKVINDLTTYEGQRTVEIIDGDLTLYNRGTENEFLATPIGVWVQSTYTGAISDREVERLRQLLTH